MNIYNCPKCGEERKITWDMESWHMMITKRLICLTCGYKANRMKFKVNW